LCGIVGYIGKKQASPILLNGLTRLEYRGYDSAGLALYVDNKITIYKTPGKLEKLKQLVGQNYSKIENATLGIGHTRWATHGIPNEINAHPHMGCDESIVIVHNGIIENFVEIKKRLVEKG